MSTRDELWREIAAERDYGPVLWPAQQNEIAEEVERRHAALVQASPRPSDGNQP